MGDDGGCYHIMIWLICRLGIFRICTFKVQVFWCYVRQNMMGMGWGIFQTGVILQTCTCTLERKKIIPSFGPQVMFFQRPATLMKRQIILERTMPIAYVGHMR